MGKNMRKTVYLVGLALVAGCVGGRITRHDPAPDVAIEEIGERDFPSRLERLERQLPLLEEYAAADQIDREAAGKALTTAESDVWLLESVFAKDKLDERQRNLALQLCKRARPSLQTLRLRIGYDQRAPRYFEWNQRLWEMQQKATATGKHLHRTKGPGN